MNDREHLDRAKSQLGFYETVCLPLFEELVEFDDRLADNVAQVRANLTTWKRRAAEDAPEPERTHSSESLPSPRREKKKGNSDE
jgi:hypothetical protein